MLNKNSLGWDNNFLQDFTFYINISTTSSIAWKSFCVEIIIIFTSNLELSYILKTFSWNSWYRLSIVSDVLKSNKGPSRIWSSDRILGCKLTDDSDWSASDAFPMISTVGIITNSTLSNSDRISIGFL